jgi:hypothetical protein
MRFCWFLGGCSTGWNHLDAFEIVRDNPLLPNFQQKRRAEFLSKNLHCSSLKKVEEHTIQLIYAIELESML